MRKERNVQTIAIIALSVAIVIMSIGYAAYTQTLNINGTSTFQASKWDIRFDKDSFSETSTIKATDKSIGDTSITYEVTLAKPNDEYSFTVNAKNFGTIDATMKKITLSGLTDAQKKYISYKVSYNGTEYTNTTEGLTEALASNASHPVVVTVKYLLPAESSDLPQTDATVNLTVALDYEDNAS